MLTGDFHRLTQLRADLQRIAAGGALRELSMQLATEVHKLALAGFKEQRDPYGKPWEPRKKPTGWAARAFGHLDDGHPILDRTGKLINSIRARATSRGVVLTTVGYAGYHQSGTSRMTARMVVPDPEMGLGEIWGGAINRVAERVVRGLLRAA